MAAVTIALGAPTTLTAAFVQWQNRDAPVGLADVSALSSDTDPRYLQRVRIWRNDRATGYMYLNAKRTTPDGSDAFATGDDFTDDWEVYTGALVFAAPNGVLTVAGPNASGSPVADSSEPYGWSPPEPFADIEAWINAYLALDTTDQGTLTITLDDGDGDLDLDAAPSTMGAMTSSAATVAIRQVATTVEPAANVDRPRATATARTNRVDLFAREHLGSDSDANCRDIIRWNVGYFRRRRSFSLGDGDVLFTAAP